MFRTLLITIAITLFFFTKPVISQTWDSINDSTYRQIVSNRFNKNNIQLGIGLEMPDVNFNTKSFWFSLQPQFGYFIADKWMLGADINAMASKTYLDSLDTFVHFNHLLFETSIRFYFHQKHRTFFVEGGPLIGDMHLADDKNSIFPHDGTVYGGKGAVGLSVFIRKFEFQILAGYRLYSDDFRKDNITQGSFFQFNLIYIFHIYD